jgi:hypothetical protein
VIRHQRKGVPNRKIRHNSYRPDNEKGDVFAGNLRENACEKVNRCNARLSGELDM